MVFTTDDVKLITFSTVFASDAHLFQVRKELNEPYIVHPVRVAHMAAMIGMDAPFIAACNLHDVLEDTNRPRVTLANLFPSRTMELVDAMTKWWGDSATVEPVKLQQFKDQYTEGLLRVQDGALLKVLDRIDNLRDFNRMAAMSPSNHKWAKRYAIKTAQEFPRLLAAVDRPQVVEMFNASLKALQVATGETNG